jgi:hypothetical protein
MSLNAKSQVQISEVKECFWKYHQTRKKRMIRMERAKLLI